MGLTQEQYEVVNSKKREIIVNACAGSGKTYAMVERCRVLPAYDKKLVLAFNKKAEESFKNRAADCPNTDVKTFHSFCLGNILSRWDDFGFTEKPSVVQRESYFFTLNQIYNSDFKSWEESPWDEEFFGEIEGSYYDQEILDLFKSKKLRMDLNEYEQEKAFLGSPGAKDQLGEEEYFERKLFLEEESERRQSYFTIHAVLSYRKHLIEANLLTFDMMVRLVAENVENLIFRHDHLIVDEFQDVDRFQFKIVRHLAMKEKLKSIAVIGDNGQRIYGWRGALKDAFSELLGDFPDAEQLYLTTNFRSRDSILKYANGVIGYDMKGVRGDIDGSVYYCDDMSQEDAISRVIGGVMKNNMILCRTNRETVDWQLRLIKRKIPVNLLGKGFDFWARKHIKIAEDLRGRGHSLAQILESDEWKKFKSKTSFKRYPERLEECVNDVNFFMNLNQGEISSAKFNMQNPNGVQISTIHKTKGLEYERVLLCINKQIEQDKCVHYVGATRAMDNLIVMRGAK